MMSSFTEVHDNFQKCFDLTNTCLKSVSFYPFINKSLPQKLYSALLFSLTVMFFFQSGIALFAVGASDGAIHLVINIATHIIMLFTMVLTAVMIKNGPNFHDVVTELKTEIWIHNSTMDSYNLEVSRHYCKIISLVSKIFYFLECLTFTFHTVCPLLVMHFYYKRKDKNSTIVILPHDMWYPFDLQTYFAYAYIYEIFATFVVASIVLWGVFFITNTTVHLHMYLKLINYAVINLVEPEEEEILDRYEKDSQAYINANLNIKNKIKVIVEKHIRIVRISSAVNSLFGLPIFIVFLLGMVLLGLCEYVISFAKNPYHILRLISLLAADFCVITTLCYLGQILSNYSYQISESAYLSNWSIINHLLHKDIGLIMQATQAPLELRPLGAVKMDFVTLLMIMKTSFSYYTLLQNVNEED